jgi:2-polyprenyl-3-methyl-5-hydroxy-6-metoxy-1,4-benzoquinol methylase
MAFTKYEQRGAYHWSELAARGPATYSARLHALYGWFRAEAGRRDPDLVIDVGCGDAALTHILSEATTGRVVGIEPEQSGVERAQEMLSSAGSRAEVAEGRGEALPFDAASVDVVVMCEVVEHIDPVEPLLEEAHRVLKPGGVLLVSTPQWQRPELRPFHVREFRAAELADVIGGCFREVAVAVSEPPRLYDSYLGNRWVRAATNTLSLAGLNPFRIRRPATPGRAAWRELHAIGVR